MVIAGGRNDALGRNVASFGKQITESGKDLRATSPNAQLAVCTVPKVEGKGGHVKRADVASKEKIKTLRGQPNFAVVDIKGQVRTEERLFTEWHPLLQQSDCECWTAPCRKGVAFLEGAQRAGEKNIESKATEEWEK